MGIIEGQDCPLRPDNQTSEETTAEGSNENEIENGANEPPDINSIKSKPIEHKGSISITPQREQATPLTPNLNRVKSPSLAAEMASTPQCSTNP